jgi:hypothetical protein
MQDVFTATAHPVPHVAPVRTFAFESSEARALAWLPLAVRFKLDLCGLRVSLREWQGLTLAQRQALLACAPGAAFGAMVLAHVPGARREPASQQGQPRFVTFERYLARKLAPVES